MLVSGEDDSPGDFWPCSAHVRVWKLSRAGLCPWEAGVLPSFTEKQPLTSPCAAVPAGLQDTVLCEPWRTLTSCLGSLRDRTDLGRARSEAWLEMLVILSAVGSADASVPLIQSQCSVFGRSPVAMSQPSPSVFCYLHLPLQITTPSSTFFPTSCSVFKCSEG